MVGDVLENKELHWKLEVPKLCSTAAETLCTRVIKLGGWVSLQDTFKFIVNPCHAWPVFLKFERSFEINMSVLNITGEISEFP